MASAMVVAMQLPLQHQLATSHVMLTSTVTSSSPPLAWPTIGSAALDIPALGVVQGFRDRVVPIASLTKMMTAWVTLQKLPLALGASGPCLVVTPDEVIAYQREKSFDESAALVVAGERLCELDLLNGLLVHSAGNYAELLATLVGGSLNNFVAQMNTSAASLGLTKTHYDDVSGFSSLSVSTALNQAKLAVLLMQSPLVRSIVDQTTVKLPVAGVVNSFTPLVGVDNVVGVKSGRTDAAGGCDVMAMTFIQGGQTRIIYAVVLGQRGGDLLGPAGDAALALSNSALANRLDHIFLRASAVGRIGWGTQMSAVVLAHRSDIYWWAAQGHLSVHAVIEHFSGTIRRGELVGWLVVHGLTTQRLELVAGRSVSAPSIWQRLR